MNSLPETLPDFTPAEILAVPPEALCAAGLSSAKARYIVELAQRVSDGQLDTPKNPDFGALLR